MQDGAVESTSASAPHPTANDGGEKRAYFLSPVGSPIQRQEVSTLDVISLGSNPKSM